MPIFQNVFNTDFTGGLILGTNRPILNFNVTGHKNSMHSMVSYSAAPYDLDPNNTLTINISFDGQHFDTKMIDVSASAANVNAATATEVVTELNANTWFSNYFIAAVVNTNYVSIQTTKQAIDNRLKVYISNLSAEFSLNFNRLAGVAELPTYFARHTIANSLTYTDSVATLIQLDPSDSDELAIIRNGLNNQAWTSSDLQDDYELFKGRSGMFNFQKITVDGSDRITQIIEYPAGAISGDLAKKIIYGYTGANTNPSQTTEEPYTLTGSDLVVP